MRGLIKVVRINSFVNYVEKFTFMKSQVKIGN